MSPAQAPLFLSNVELTLGLLAVNSWTAAGGAPFSSSEALKLQVRFGLLVAAVGHDLGHPGVNNPFLVEPGPWGPLGLVGIYRN